jgi:hypothetical protein
VSSEALRRALPEIIRPATDLRLVGLAEGVRRQIETPHLLYTEAHAANMADAMGTVLARLLVELDHNRELRTRCDALAEHSTALLAEEQKKLATIAEHVHPCPPPAVAQGYDSCEHGTWPCRLTEAVWLARGLDPREQYAEAHRGWRADMMADALLSESVGDDAPADQDQ